MQHKGRAYRRWWITRKREWWITKKGECWQRVISFFACFLKKTKQSKTKGSAVGWGRHQITLAEDSFTLSQTMKSNIFVTIQCTTVKNHFRTSTIILNHHIGRVFLEDEGVDGVLQCDFAVPWGVQFWKVWRNHYLYVNDVCNVSVDRIDGPMFQWETNDDDCIFKITRVLSRFH